jgi:hypothetical protein
VFIAFIKGIPPLMGKRVLSFSDPLFRRSSLAWILLAIVAVGAWFAL